MNKVLLVVMACFILSTACEKTSPSNIIDETLYVRHQGSDMPAYIHGNKENQTFLIAIHGAGSFGLSFRDENFINKLEEEYVVVYFDNRAQSMSQGNFPETKDIIELMASDVEALMEVLQYKYGMENSYFLMGHSLGGMITGTALLDKDFQSMFKAWINVDGVFDMPSVMAWRVELLYDVADEQISLGNSVAEWQNISDKLDEIDYESDKAYQEVFELIVVAYDLVTINEQINTPFSLERLYQTTVINNPLTWQVSHVFNKPELTARLEEYSILDRMQNISIPTLFTYGKYDFSVPPESGFAAFEELQSFDKNFSIYDRTTHHPFVTESAKFTNELASFIERLR